MAGAYLAGVDLSENGLALQAMLDGGPGQHFLGSPHTLANFETAFWRSELSDNNSFEQWELNGGHDAAERANAAWKRRLAEYEEPLLDQAVHEELRSVDGSAQGELPRLGRLAGPCRRASALQRYGGLDRLRRRRQDDVLDLRLGWSPRSSSSGMWHFIRCPGSTSMSGGSATSQTPSMKRWHRGWNTQPLGGLAGLGISPCRGMRLTFAAIHAWHRRQQGLGVGMVRAVEHVVGVADLHDPTEVHHGDAVGEVSDHTEVVADEQVARALLGLQLRQQVEDCGLHGYIERTGRLVGDDDARVAGKGAGDCDALLQATRQLCRLHVEVAWRQPQMVGQLADLAISRSTVGSGELAHGSGEDPANGPRCVQCRIGVLEDDLHRPFVGRAALGDRAASS